MEAILKRRAKGMFILRIGGNGRNKIWESEIILKMPVAHGKTAVSGNVVWSLQCPRYHKDMQYNERQMLREKDGVAKHPTTCQYISQKKRTRLHSEHTPISSKKVKTGVRPDLSDEGIGQSASPVSPSPADLADSSQRQSSKEDSDWDILDLAHGAALPTLDEAFVLEPFLYVSSLPSKCVRDMVIDGINL
ncbi:hypothetical protein F4814DRAFT_445692 [Daldinia grandis]|nr:hypothetical protein F4814DRAFT_445692 [Daldinia grandis]